MPALRITIGSRDFQVSCDEGQEAHLKSLARLLDERLTGFGAGANKGNDPQYLMLVGLMLTDELEDAKRELAHLRHEIRHSSQSFETNKQIEMEGAIAATIHDIAARVEAIAGELERV